MLEFQGGGDVARKGWRFCAVVRFAVIVVSGDVVFVHPGKENPVNQVLLTVCLHDLVFSHDQVRIFNSIGLVLA